MNAETLKMVDDFYEKWDANKDGGLSMSEMILAGGESGSFMIAQHFKTMLDSNVDGVVQVEELRTFVRNSVDGGNPEEVRQVLESLFKAGPPIVPEEPAETEAAPAGQ